MPQAVRQVGRARLVAALGLGANRPGNACPTAVVNPHVPLSSVRFPSPIRYEPLRGGSVRLDRQLQPKGDGASPGSTDSVEGRVDVR